MSKRSAPADPFMPGDPPPPTKHTPGKAGVWTGWGAGARGGGLGPDTKGAPRAKSSVALRRHRPWGCPRA